MPMNGVNHRIKLTICDLKYHDSELEFGAWGCNQTGIQCRYCIVKERYDSRDKHRKRPI